MKQTLSTAILITLSFVVLFTVATLTSNRVNANAELSSNAAPADDSKLSSLIHNV